MLLGDLLYKASGHEASLSELPAPNADEPEGYRQIPRQALVDKSFAQSPLHHGTNGRDRTHFGNRQSACFRLLRKAVEPLSADSCGVYSTFGHKSCRYCRELASGRGVERRGAYPGRRFRVTSDPDGKEVNPEAQTPALRCQLPFV